MIPDAGMDFVDVGNLLLSGRKVGSILYRRVQVKVDEG